MPAFKPKPSSATPAATLRRHAEGQLRKQQTSKVKSQKSQADPQRTLHELQVHQIELEMQNLELQEARNQMETQLEKYTDLYDFAPVGYFSLNEQGVILEANLTGASLVGSERSRLIDRRISTLLAAASQSDFRSFLKRVFEGSGSQDCEAELLKESGDVRWVALRGTSAISSSDPRKLCRVSVSNITAHKQAEEFLRGNESLFSNLIEQAPMGVYVVDDQFRLVQVNPRAMPNFGKIQPLIGRDFSEVTHLVWPKKIAGDVVARFRHTLQTGKTYDSGDFSGQRRDTGAEESHEWQVQRITLPAGHHGAVCFFHNVTERKQAGEAVARLAAIVKSSEDAIISKNPEGLITTWNRGAERLFGYAEAEALGQPLGIIFRRKHLVAGVSKRIHKGEIIGSFETVCRHKDGRSVDVSLTISSITDAEGRIVGMSKIMRDITERKKAEETQRRIEVLASSNKKLEKEIIRRVEGETALKQSKESLMESLARARQQREELRFLTRAVLSAQEDERKRISRELHDVIAQTLTGIHIRLENLKKSAVSEPTDLEENIERTQKLVDQSVDMVHRFARELRPSALDHLGLIPALQSFLKNFTARTGVQTHLTAFTGVERLEIADRTVLYRVAQEAITNVGRHAEANRVKVTLRNKQDGIHMIISDDGKSFGVEKTLRANKGNRLGLLGMRERLEMVGGAFGIKSEAGKGTTIVATIPIKKASHRRQTFGVPNPKSPQKKRR